MRVEPLEPVGALLTGVSLSDPAGFDVGRVTALLAEHGVLVLRNQVAGDEDFVAFLRRFGDLTFTTGETPVPGFDDLNIVTNVGRTRPPRSTLSLLAMSSMPTPDR